MKKRTFLLIAYLALVLCADAQVAIQSSIFGQNAWYIDVTQTDTNLISPSFDDRLADIAASGVKFVRIGGITPNFKPLYSWSGTYTITLNSQVEKLMHLIWGIRVAGMEPIVEVGFNPVCSGVTPLGGVSQTNQATVAGNLVTYLNNPSTGLCKGDPIMYWIIANEPDLSTNCTADYGGFGYDNTGGTDAVTIASYIQEFSTKMKTAFPTITIIGPELTTYGNDASWKGNMLMNDLLSNPGTNPTKSIMGTISGGAANGKYFVDVVSFHHYPSSSTRANVIAEPTATSDGFKNKLSSSGLSGKRGIVEMITTNTSRTSANLQIACTEFNLTNNNSTYDESTSEGNSNMIKDVGYRSFLGGQWMAEMFAWGMNSGWVQFMNPWSVQEGASPCTEGMGYISGCNGNNVKRPNYWHYKMMADNFAGTYYPCTTNTTTYKAFAFVNTTPNPDQIGVIIMNQDLQSPRGTDYSVKSLRINFNNGAVSGGEDILFDFDMGASVLSDYSTCSIPGETTMLLVFEAGNTTPIKKQIYGLSQALNNEAPLDVSNTTNTIAVQNDINNYSPGVYNIINITPTTNIGLGSTDIRTFRFMSSTTITTTNGEFTVPSGAECTIIPTQGCY